jgi:hypothetical protein
LPQQALACGTLLAACLAVSQNDAPVDDTGKIS